MALSIAAIADIGIGSGRLIKTSNECTCPGDIVTYNCNITGSGFTVWRGSAFDCPERESRIRLRHSLFGTDDGSMGLCNDGVIVGRSLGVSTDSLNNTVFMSQLIINLTSTSNVVGQTVECVYLIGAEETIIGSTIVDIADPPPPPTNVQLVDISSEQLIFNWTAVDSNCSTLQYNIIASSCGVCADNNIILMNSTASSVTCFISLSVNMMRCSFGIQSVICTDVSGNLSTPLIVTPKVPQSPTFSSVTPHYNKTDNDSKLTNIDVKFNEVEAFMISDRFDGSALNYTVTYTDSTTGTICESLTILAPLCIQGICEVPPFNPLLCFERFGEGDIDISVSASNLLGKGPPSVITIGQTNKYVNITFEQNKIVCTFLDQQGGQLTQISCRVAYGPCQQQPNMVARGSVTSPSTVDIDLPAIPQTNEYCYVVNASNGTFAIFIKGLLKLNQSIIVTDSEPGDESGGNQGLIIGVTVPVFAIMLIVSIFGAVAVVVAFIYWRQNKNRKLLLASTAYSDTDEGLDVTEHLLSDSCNDEPQRIPVHISFKLEDKPQELLKVLKKFEKLKINLKNVRIGRCEELTAEIDDTPRVGKSYFNPCTALKKRHTKLNIREIYIECEEDLDEKVKEDIQKLKIGIADTKPKVSCKPELQDYDKDITDAESIAKVHHIKEYIKHKPGALLSLLTLVYSVKECNHINITDIDITALGSGTNKCGRVTIKFLPDMAEDWKEKYDNKRYKCKVIVNPPRSDTEAEQISVL